MEGPVLSTTKAKLVSVLRLKISVERTRTMISPSAWPTLESEKLQVLY